MPTLHDHTPRDLVALAKRLGLPAYRGRQLAHGLYQRLVRDLDELSDLPRDLRQQLAEEFGLCTLEVVAESAGGDGTTKYLFRFADGTKVEAVYLPRDDSNQTYCISSQVGCRMACVFCATGRMGLLRSLSAGEIVAQVIELRRRHPSRRSPNLVFMGMGEPLDNFDALRDALEILCDEAGLGLSARRITISTAGLIDGIRRLAELGRPYGLAVSLTTGIEAERAELMPVAGRTPMLELLEAAADYGRKKRRRVTLECALIAGRNDSEAHARHLLALARRGPFKVNLIPLNPIEKFDGARPDRTQIDRMVDVLWQGGVVATVRDSQGRQVDAACGQLVHRQRRR
jgi:23S rRNA (adenine2503-C2)-methyltransferase